MGLIGSIGRGFGLIPGQQIDNPVEQYKYNTGAFNLGLAPEGMSSLYNVDTGQSDEFRKRQIDFINQLRSQAQGTSSPVSDAQIARARSGFGNQAMASVASARGPQNVGMQRRTLMNALASNDQSLAGQADLLKLQEQQQAQNQFGQLSGLMRGQDIGLAQNQAEGDYQARVAQMEAQKQLEKWRGSDALGRSDVLAQVAQGRLNDQQRRDAALAGAVGAGAAAAFSDERLKTDIKPADKDVAGFLDALTAHKYKYKNGDGGEDVSVMAQDLEKTEMGKRMVVNTDAGKMVDYGKGFGALLAAQVELNKRLKSLEKRA